MGPISNCCLFRHTQYTDHLRRHFGMFRGQFYINLCRYEFRNGNKLPMAKFNRWRNFVEPYIRGNSNLTNNQRKC